MKQTNAPIVLGNEVYYSVPKSVSFWEGIAPTNNDEIFYISGTASNKQAALYKGPLEILDNYPIYNFLFPNSIASNAYGTHYLGKNNCDEDIIRIVGSYQFSKNLNDPTFAYVFTGTFNDLTNPKNFHKIEPFKPAKFSVAHSTSGILAVYVISDVSPASAAVGECAIYNIEKKKTITQILFPSSVSTTAYGIWYNGFDNGYQSYTIAGGFSITPGPIDTNSYIVDFLYNEKTGEYYFTNWTEIKVYSDAKLESHTQGLTRLKNGNYICATENIFKDNNTTEFIVNAMCVELKRTGGKFVIVGTTIYTNPNGKITDVTSAALNAVVGSYIDSNNKDVPYIAASFTPKNN